MCGCRVLDLPALPPTGQRPDLPGGPPVREFVALDTGEQALGAGARCAADSPGLALGTAQGVVKRVAAGLPANRDDWEVIAPQATATGWSARSSCADRRRRPGVHHHRRPAAAVRRRPGAPAGPRRRRHGRASGWRRGARRCSSARSTPSAASGRRRRDRRRLRGRAARAPRPARSRSPRSPSTRPRAAATGGVRCHRFLKGEDAAARLGRPRARAGRRRHGVPVALPADPRRDGSGTPLPSRSPPSPDACPPDLSPWSSPASGRRRTASAGRRRPSAPAARR